jgi:gamma-tubulin complex component 3
MDQILEEVGRTAVHFFDTADRFLAQVSKPFFSTLQRWIFSGELHDPFNEFFVQLNPETSLREGRLSPYHAAGDAGFEGGMDIASGVDEAGKVWEKKYVFVKGMVPGFVSEDFAKKVTDCAPVILRSKVEWLY